MVFLQPDEGQLCLDKVVSFRRRFSSIITIEITSITANLKSSNMSRHDMKKNDILCERTTQEVLN